jgi:hypothetical protein
MLVECGQSDQARRVSITHPTSIYLVLQKQQPLVDGSHQAYHHAVNTKDNNDNVPGEVGAHFLDPNKYMKLLSHSVLRVNGRNKNVFLPSGSTHSRRRAFRRGGRRVLRRIGPFCDVTAYFKHTREQAKAQPAMIM